MNRDVTPCPVSVGGFRAGLFNLDIMKTYYTPKEIQEYIKHEMIKVLIANPAYETN